MRLRAFPPRCEPSWPCACTSVPCALVHAHRSNALSRLEPQRRAFRAAEALVTSCSAALQQERSLELTSRTNSTARSNSSGTTTSSSSTLTVTTVADQHAEIRRRVAEQLPNGGLIYIESGTPVIRNGDVPYAFRPNSDFYYLTGVAEPNFAAVIDAATGRFTLLAPRIPDAMIVWIGGLPSLEALAEEYGADACCYKEDLGRLLQASPAERLYVLPVQSSTDGAEAKQVLQRFGGEVSTGLADILHPCRAVKTGAEAACLAEASRVSGAAHMAMWRASRPGMREHELEAFFMQHAWAAGLRQVGYPSIVGAGRNAAILHYERNNCVAAAGQLVLVDAGVEFRCYTADISRTFPISGSFSALQRDAYGAVLAVQEAALQLMEPQTRWSEIISASRTVFVDGLRELGLVRGATSDILEQRVDTLFQPHGLGHFLGLDVHDVSGGGPVPGRLAPGNVVTCEPGLYFVESLLRPALEDPRKREFLGADRVEAMMDFGGVRIEDNVLITEGGSLNLTMEAGVPKSVADMEAVMRS